MASVSYMAMPLLFILACLAAPTTTAATFFSSERVGAEKIDILKCWTFLTNIPGCAQEIYKAYQGGMPGAGGMIPIGPTCCKAINTINDDCWAGMFPNPFFPPMLKGYCALAGIDIPPAEGPGTGVGPGPGPEISPFFKS